MQTPLFKKQSSGEIVSISYGATMTIFSYLTPLEFTLMQQLSKWYYETNLPRLQNSFPLTSLPCNAFAYFIAQNVVDEKVAGLYRFNATNQQIADCAIQPEIL